MTSVLFDQITILIVVGNSIVLSLYGDLFANSQDSLENANDAFTYLFLCEFIMKFIGLGFIEYFSDVTNYLDLIVVICGLIDIQLRTVFPTNTRSINQQRVMNISLIKGIRIFRVLRIIRLLRNMKTMRRIMYGIYDSLLKIFSVLILLVIFLLIYMNFGMSVLKGSLSLSEHLNAFYLVFQVLSIENWNSVLYELS